MSQQPDSRHDAAEDEPVEAILAEGVDEDAIESNRRLFEGWQWWLVATLAVAYSSFHLISLNIYPLETWSFRIVHICGALILGYASYAGSKFAGEGRHASPVWLSAFSYALLIPAGYALIQVVLMQRSMNAGAMRIDPAIENLRRRLQRHRRPGHRRRHAADAARPRRADAKSQVQNCAKARRFQLRLLLNATPSAKIPPAWRDLCLYA